VKTFKNPIGVECCAACSKPVGDLAADQRLVHAAKRLRVLWRNQQLGIYYSPNEDLHAQRELVNALIDLEAADAHAQAREREMSQR
jgi:hypothetical protein